MRGEAKQRPFFPYCYYIHSIPDGYRALSSRVYYRTEVYYEYVRVFALSRMWKSRAQFWNVLASQMYICGLGRGRKEAANDGANYTLHILLRHCSCQCISTYSYVPST